MCPSEFSSEWGSLAPLGIKTKLLESPRPMATTTLPTISQATSAQKRTLIAAALGWGLDGFDVLLYSNVQIHVMTALGIHSKAIAGLPNAFMLLASGIGGVLFGFIADRIGRTKALMLSILTYSLCSLGSGFSTSIYMLIAFLFVLGLGMGGEWNTGAALVAETWPTHLRARAIAIVQSAWAWGLAAAALTAWIVLDRLHLNWRFVFFVGVLPALVTLWIRKSVPESEMWKQHRDQATSKAPFSEIFSPVFRKQTIFLLLLNIFGLFAWWGLFSWMPPYLTLPVEKGGRGLSMMNTTTLLVTLNLVGMFPGYLCYGWFADKLGRKRSLILYTLCAAGLIPLYAAARTPWVILILGALVGFFGTGFFAGSGIIGSELFPTRVRARALGFTYNGARALSCVAPYTIGWVGDKKGLSAAFLLCALAFVLTALMATQLPETKGKQLE
ncbi:MAG: major facilitator superfamily transporter [Candidatus Angelobacter sp.]|nr:major facilitator superfamily transporter [Candidatus Angelobacter sp.]